MQSNELAEIGAKANSSSWSVDLRRGDAGVRPKRWIADSARFPPPTLRRHPAPGTLPSGQRKPCVVRRRRLAVQVRGVVRRVDFADPLHRPCDNPCRGKSRRIGNLAECGVVQVPCEVKNLRLPVAELNAQFRIWQRLHAFDERVHADSWRNGSMRRTSRVNDVAPGGNYAALGCRRDLGRSSLNRIPWDSRRGRMVLGCCCRRSWRRFPMWSSPRIRRSDSFPCPA